MHAGIARGVIDADPSVGIGDPAVREKHVRHIARAFFAEGAYGYDARGNKLVRAAEGDLRKLTGMQDFVFTAPLNLVYAADLAVYEGRNIPAEHSRYLCGQNAAGYAENVNLYTAGHGLKSITRGSAPEAELLEALGLDPGRYFLALAQTVGK